MAGTAIGFGFGMGNLLPYNPLDKKIVGASVSGALLGRKLQTEKGLPAFHGAGIFVIYYSGSFDASHQLIERNQGADPVARIVVGKAILAGGRKGDAASEGSKTKALCTRLRKHAESITANPKSEN